MRGIVPEAGRGFEQETLSGRAIPVLPKIVYRDLAGQHAERSRRVEIAFS
jgi:hypothetical protein